MPSLSTATSSNSPARYASPAPGQVAFLSVRQPSARGRGPASSAERIMENTLIRLVSKINTRAERKVEKALYAEARKVHGKTAKLGASFTA
jgi:hypothetical protein